MESAATGEKHFQRGAQTRKTRRNVAPADYTGRQSVNEPKTLKQLIKNSEKHEISKLIQEIEEEMNQNVQPDSASNFEQQSQPKNDAMEEEQSDEGSGIEATSKFEREFCWDFRVFRDLYEEIFLEGTFSHVKPLNNELYEKEANLKLLAKLYFLCDKDYYEANSLQLWKDLPKCFTEQELAIMKHDPKTFYKEHLFFFDRFSRTTDKSKNELKESLRLQVEYLTDPYIRYPPDKEQLAIDDQLLEEVMQEQCVLLKGFVDALGIDPKIFNIKSIAQNHQIETIQITCQKPDLAEFQQIPQKEIKKIKLNEYYDYLRKCIVRKPQDVSDSNGLLHGALNIDISDWNFELEELAAKLPQNWISGSEYDVLKPMDRKLKAGPRLSFKVEGVWVGGHQEELNLRLINLNYGPDSCVWFTVGTEDAKRFKELVKESYHVDIEKEDDLLWFSNVDFCIKNGIKIQYFVQEPGDIVLLGPGCLNWSQATGIVMNTAWNFWSKDRFQFEKAFEKYLVHEKYRVKSAIPLKDISLKLILKEVNTIPTDLRCYLLEQLCKLYEDEMDQYLKFVTNFSDILFTYQPQDYIISNCIVCNKEILNFCVHCDTCSKAKKSKKTIVHTCLECYQAHLNDCKGQKTNGYYKLSSDMVVDFIQIMRSIQDNGPSQYSSLDEYLEKMVSEDKRNKSLNKDSAVQQILGNSQEQVVENKMCVEAINEIGNDKKEENAKDSLMQENDVPYFEEEFEEMQEEIIENQQEKKENTEKMELEQKEQKENTHPEEEKKSDMEYVVEQGTHEEKGETKIDNGEKQEMIEHEGKEQKMKDTENQDEQKAERKKSHLEGKREKEEILECFEQIGTEKEKRETNYGLQEKNKKVESGLIEKHQEQEEKDDKEKNGHKSALKGNGREDKKAQDKMEKIKQAEKIQSQTRVEHWKEKGHEGSKHETKETQKGSEKESTKLKSVMTEKKIEYNSGAIKVQGKETKHVIGEHTTMKIQKEDKKLLEKRKGSQSLAGEAERKMSSHSSTSGTKSSKKEEIMKGQTNIKKVAQHEVYDPLKESPKKLDSIQKTSPAKSEFYLENLLKGLKSSEPVQAEVQKNKPFKQIRFTDEPHKHVANVQKTESIVIKQQQQLPQARKEENNDNIYKRKLEQTSEEDEPVFDQGYTIKKKVKTNNSGQQNPENGSPRKERNSRSEISNNESERENNEQSNSEKMSYTCSFLDKLNK